MKLNVLNWNIIEQIKWSEIEWNSMVLNKRELTRLK